MFSKQISSEFFRTFCELSSDQKYFFKYKKVRLKRNPTQSVQRTKGHRFKIKS